MNFKHLISRLLVIGGLLAAPAAFAAGPNGAAYGGNRGGHGGWHGGGWHGHGHGRHLVEVVQVSIN